MAEGDKIRPAREEATGTTRDESFADHMAETAKKWSANDKRTYDEYQQESLESIRRNRTHVDQILALNLKVLSDAQQHDNERAKLANIALANAVDTSNAVNKQAIRHSDIAIENQWETVQEGAGDTLMARAISLDDASLKAIGAAVAAAVVEGLKAK